DPALSGIVLAQGRHFSVIQRPLMVVAPVRDLLKIESAETGDHFVQTKRTRHRRFGARKASAALAKAAGGADRRRGDLPRLAGHARKGCAINGFVVKTDVAAKKDSGAARALIERALRP